MNTQPKDYPEEQRDENVFPACLVFCLMGAIAGFMLGVAVCSMMWG